MTSEEIQALLAEQERLSVENAVLRGQVLLDGGPGLVLSQLFDISHHNHWCQLGQGDMLRITPGGESGNSAGSGSSRVAIAGC